MPAASAAVPPEPGASAAGKVVVVTGGAQGIGRAIALEAARRGASLAIVDRSEEDLRATREAVEAAAPTEAPHAFLVGDAADRDSVERGFARVEEELGAPYGLVNNVGTNPPGEVPVEEIDPDLWEAAVATTLGSTFLCSRAAIPRMRAAGEGRIVNIASIVASRALPRIAAYNAAKAGVVALTQTLALELAAEGILVNAVAPGHILTENAKAKFPPGFIEKRQTAIPAGRHGEPGEIARAVAFLLFDASWLTGAVLPVDGGMSAATLRAL